MGSGVGWLCESRDGGGIVVGRHEDDRAELLVVGLMEDDGLDGLFRLLVDPPCVVLCVDGEPGVVVEVVELSETAVAAELVAAGRGCGCAVPFGVGGVSGSSAACSFSTPQWLPSMMLLAMTAVVFW